MFHFDRGLKITAIDLALDFRRRQPHGFISHAHADHMAPHETAYCTPVTGALYRHRQGKHRCVVEMPFDRPLEWNDFTLTTLPAGHVFGSAMLQVDRGGKRLLYTGDFKLEPSLTAEECRPPHAEILVMESTWGDPRFRLPPRKETIEKMLSLTADAFADRRTPVIHAYVLGKAQEVTKCLTQAGIPVLQHPMIYEVSKIYRDRGCDLGDFGLYTGTPHAGHAVIVPPRMQKGFHVGGLTRTLTIAVTGWAIDALASQRWGTDYVLPLSDHSDFEQLLETVRLVAPERIYCTHGPESFVNELIDRGYRAFVLGKTPQLTLF